MTRYEIDRAFASVGGVAGIVAAVMPLKRRADAALARVQKRRDNSSLVTLEGAPSGPDFAGVRPGFMWRAWQERRVGGLITAEAAEKLAMPSAFDKPNLATAAKKTADGTLPMPAL